VVITPTAVEPEDPRSYYSVAKRLVAETPNAILANQYHNPENPQSHYLTTGPEIWEQTRGQVTDVVMTMGTGGTISGAGRYIKERNPAIRLVGVDASGSILLEAWQNKGHIPPDARAAPYKVEGFGEDFIPSTLDLSIIDDILRVTDKESFLWTRRLVKEEGIFCGGSSGAAVAAAVRYARELPAERLVVVLLPDSGSRYLSKIFDDKWMRENGFLEALWSEATLRGALAAKPSPALITANQMDSIVSVVAMMKQYDISQVPVLNGDGSLVGMVTEVDLLKYMLESGTGYSPEESIAAIVQPARAVYPADTPLGDVLQAFVEGQVILVTEAGKPAGILTKIDLLDFMTQEG
jgi:cystathionine beta-synthase